MISQDIAKQLEKALDHDTKPLLKEVPAGSLSEQMAMMERVEAELAARLKTERCRLIAQYERDVVEAEIAHRQAREDAVARLEAGRRETLGRLTNALDEALWRNEAMMKRLQR